MHKALIAALLSIAGGLFVGVASSEELIPYRVMSKSQLEDFGESFGAAQKDSARPLIRISLELIKAFEGWIPTAYNDPVGLCTIGYGHLIAMKRCEQIELGKFSKTLSEKEGEQLLEEDTVGARLAVQSLVKVEMNDEQFGALTSFVFNVGKGNFAQSTLLRLLNDGAYDAAAGQFGRWVKAKDRLLPGLVARRACEEALFRQQLSLTKDGKFDRAGCRSFGVAPGAGDLVDIDVGEVP